jgi:GWxTD domain-containing protein
MFLRYSIRITLTLFLLIIQFHVVQSFSKKGLTQEQKKILSCLEKIDATKQELDTLSILFKSNSPARETQKRIDFIIQRKISRLNLEHQKIYYTLGDEERFSFLLASDKDRWMRKRENKAIEKLCKTREGKIQYYALGDLLTEKEFTDFIQQDSTGRVAWLKRYWALRDPTSTTPENEWENEFDRRVEVAIQNYHSNFGQKPWDDRGDVYIKLGPPEQCELSADSSWKAYLERKRGFVSATEQEFYRSACETWNYTIGGKDVLFQFEDMKYTGYYQLVPHKSGNPIENLDYLYNFNVEKAKLGTAKAVYHHDYGGKPLDFAWEVIRFRSLNNVYEILVNVGIPTDKLDKDSSGLVRYTQQIAVRNEKGEIVNRDSIKVCQQVPDIKNQLLIDQRRFLLSSGMYQVVVEIRDTKSKKIGLYKEDIFLPGYVIPASITNPPLELSRAILSSSVRKAQPDESESKFFLNGYLIIPNPGHIFLEEQEPEIRAYFEIYNLLPENDTLRFATISQIIKYVSSDSAVVSSDTTITIHSGYVPGSFAYQILQLSSNSGLDLEPGDYLWRIDVVDLNAPSKAESIVNKLKIIKGQTKEVLSSK